MGEDYYRVNSTFEYFPGLSIFHSRDLSIGKWTFPSLLGEGEGDSEFSPQHPVL